MARKNAKRDAARRKAVGRAPNYLKTVMISLPPKEARVRGSFGAASAVVRIDPATGLPIPEAC